MDEPNVRERPEPVVAVNDCCISEEPQGRRKARPKPAIAIEMKIPRNRRMARTFGYNFTAMGTPEEAFKRVIALVRRLRSEDGCPWDREHHFRDYLRMLMEEAKELEAALELGDTEETRAELGDTVWNALYLLVLGEDELGYKMEEVLRSACEKIISRHPHVFGGEVARNPDEVLEIWRKVKEQEKAKQAEKRRPGGLRPGKERRRAKSKRPPESRSSS